MAQLTGAKAIRAQLVMKAETTGGVDVLGGAYTQADIVNIEAGSLQFTQDPNEIENKMTAGNMGRAPSLIGKLTGMIEASMFFRGAGATYTASVKPEIDMILRAAGHSAVFTTSGGAKWTYQPTTADELFTAYAVMPTGSGTGAAAVRLVGCLISRLVMQTVAGQGLKLDFSIMGALHGTTGRDDITTYVAGALSPTPTPPITKGAAFVLDDGAGYSPRIRSLGFDVGLQCQYIDSINAAGAVAGVMRMDRAPTLQIDPEQDLNATSAFWEMLRDGSPMNFSTFQVGSATWNRLKFQFGAGGTNRLLQLVKQGITIRDGLMVLPSVFRATLSAENNDYALVAD